jgi:hypothetical protein
MKKKPTKRSAQLIAERNKRLGREPQTWLFEFVTGPSDSDITSFEAEMPPGWRPQSWDEQKPSVTMFEYPWPPDDPAWAWLDAFDAIHERKDLTYLLALVPDRARPFIKDFFETILFASKRGPQTPLWRAPLIERAARKLDQLIKQDKSLTVEVAAERVLAENAEKFAGIKQQSVIDQHSGRSTSGRRWKKRRPTLD